MTTNINMKAYIAQVYHQNSRQWHNIPLSRIFHDEQEAKDCAQSYAEKRSCYTYYRGLEVNDNTRLTIIQLENMVLFFKKNRKITDSQYKICINNIHKLNLKTVGETLNLLKK